MSRILLGVSAGIAIYKVIDLASKLTQRGDEVRTVMTPHALKFVTPLSFRAVTRQHVFTDTFEDDPEYRPDPSPGSRPDYSPPNRPDSSPPNRPGHISLAEWPDVIFIAPATADLIARVAAGLGDTLLTVTLIASQRPVLIAPTMNDRMWANPIVQANISRLKEVGYRFVEPAVGHLACGATGPGRLPETPSLIQAIDAVLGSASR